MSAHELAQLNTGGLLSEPSLSRLLADVVLTLHLAVAAFVVGGLVAVLLGNLRNWHGVNNLWFRLAHLAAIAVVAAESCAGFVCPLTTLEMWLRSRAGATTYEGGFVEHWFHRLLFYSAPPWVFTAGYCGFGLAVLAAWWYFPPSLQRGARQAGVSGLRDRLRAGNRLER